MLKRNQLEIQSNCECSRLDGVAGSPDAAIDSILNDPNVDWDTAIEMVEFIDNFTWLHYLRFLLLGLAIFGIFQAIKKRSS